MLGMLLKGKRVGATRKPKMGVGRRKKHGDLSHELGKQQREPNPSPWFFSTLKLWDAAFLGQEVGLGRRDMARRGCQHPPSGSAVTLGIPAASLHPWEGEDEDEQGGGCQGRDLSFSAQNP